MGLAIMKKQLLNLLMLNVVPWIVALITTHGQLTMLIVINLLLINIGLTLSKVF